jgi:hypothetical protein
MANNAANLECKYFGLFALAFPSPHVVAYPQNSCVFNLCLFGLFRKQAFY